MNVPVLWVHVYVQVLVKSRGQSQLLLSTAVQFLGGQFLSSLKFVKHARQGPTCCLSSVLGLEAYTTTAGFRLDFNYIYLFIL